MTGRHTNGDSSTGSGVLILIWGVGVSLVVSLLLTVGGLGEALAKAPIFAGHCPSERLSTTRVTVTVAPEVEAAVREALLPVAKQRIGDHCVEAVVTGQASGATVAAASGTPAAPAPDVWVPDSSVWRSRVPWGAKPAGSLASTPVVIATSRQTVDALGWGARPPSWQEALTGKLPLAVPDLTASAPGLSAVISLWQSLGKGEAAQNALAAVVLSTARAGVPTEEQALSEVRTGSDIAPLLATSAQAVLARNADSATDTTLVPIRPTGGAPALDYPVLRIDRPTTDSTRAQAVDAVTAALRAPGTAALMRRAGFDGPAAASTADTSTPSATTTATSSATGTTTPSPAGGSPAPSPSSDPRGSAAVAGLTDVELGALMQRIAALTAPSRILVAVDQSGSMEAQAGNGATRIVFAEQTLRIAGELLPDRAQVGLWSFARDIDGEKDYRELQPMAPLGSKLAGAVTQRESFNIATFRLRYELGGNGTALYSTAVAAMEKAKGLYDPRAGNAVVLFTDGANTDPGGPELEETVARLKALYDPKKPVRLICVGIGPDADMDALGQLAGAGGGLAQKATDPRILPQVLFEVMNRRG